VVGGPSQSDPEFDRWLETNVQEQKDEGYAVVTVRVDQGNLTTEQMRGLAALARNAGEGRLRVTIEQNLILGWVHVSNLRRVFAALKMIDLASANASRIDDVVTCPGAYSCNLALTKSMNLGSALAPVVAEYTDPQVQKLSIKISGCPNSCGQHWLGDVGFYGNSRKIDGKEVPYYLMLLGGGYDEEGMMRFGLAVQSLPARFAPEAVRRVLDHFIEHRQENESFRQYVMRNRIETFKQLTADLVKPAPGDEEMFRDWGDDVAFSLQLGRGECAS
jgi:sulfite reductase beta subunit-like hemoprotein